MDRVRQAGREVRVMDPLYANFDPRNPPMCGAPMPTEAKAGEAALLALFGNARTRAKGDQGFFDPDNFRFGEPRSRAALIGTLAGSALGRVRVEGDGPATGLGSTGVHLHASCSMPVGVNELVRVANDRDLPERGAVRLLMEGGA